MKHSTVPQCSNCCRAYTVTGETRQPVLRVPLLLECGHSFCSVCVNQLGRVQRGTGVITCPQCAEQTTFIAGEEAARQLPCNIFILGLVAANKLNLGGKIPTNGVVSRSLIMRENPSDIYIDLPSPLPADEFSIECEECKTAAAEVKCTTCKNYLCDKCFEMGHSAMAIFRSHVKIPITLAMSSPTHCSVHKGHMTQFYCRDDSTHICSECITMDTHKEHQVVSIQDEADYCRQQLKPMVVSARSILKRMKKSDKSLSELLPKLHCYIEKLITQIHEDFCSLHYSLQLREQRLLEQLVSEGDSYVQPILRMRKLLQDNIAMATKTINNVQRLLGDSIAIVKSQQIVNSKLQQVLQMESHLHCDEGEPLNYCMSQSAYTELLSVGAIECANQYRVALSTTPTDNAVDEELVTSSDGQSYDSETLIHSSVDHTPQKDSTMKESPKAKVGVAGQQMGVAHPPGLPMPTTSQQQLQHHVRQLLQEVSSSDHLSSSDNDEQKIRRTVTPAQQVYQLATQQLDKQSSPLPQQQAVSPKLDTSVNSDDANVTPLSATPRDLEADSLDASTPRIGGGPAECGEDEDITPTYMTKDNDYFGVAMATPSTEDDTVIKDVAAKNDDDDNVVIAGSDGEQLVKVIVSHIEDPSEFYIQYSSDHHNLIGLMTQLAEYCNDSFTAVKFNNAKPGLVCAAKYQEDDLWYRAEVLESFQPSSVKVKYIDFGNKEWLNCKRLCVLPLEMINQPPYCHCCSIHDLHPIDGTEWNMSLISRFKAIAMDTEFQMKVVSSDHHGNNMVDLMLPPLGPWISSHLLQTAMCTNAAGLAASSTPPMQMSPHPLPNIGIQLECFVSYALTPNKFYIQLPTTQLEKLMMELQDYANERHPLMTLPSPGTPCLAQFSLDQVWYRAVVTSIEGENCVVKYVDYGNSELVAMTTLQELQPKHCKLPEQAICCTLISACCPADGWSREVLQQFADMVTNATLLLSVIDIVDGVVAMETVHGTPINEFLSQSGIYQMKNPVPIATDIPAATVPVIGTCCEAMIVNVQWPSNFHVQLTHSQYQLHSAMKAVEKQKVHPKKIEVGHCYLAVESINVSLVLYRVCVVAALATVSEQYEVYFIDNGWYTQIEAHNLLEMPPSLVSIPSLALRCALDHVIPLDEEWSEQCLEFFSRLILGKVVAITIKDIPDEQEDPVLVDMSVELPGSGRTEDVGAFLMTNQFAKQAKPLLLAYKPATPPSDGRVTVIHINDHGVICCQATNSATTLKRMMDVLQTVAKKGRHRPRLAVNQPCAAIFSEDNLWYRAKVISIATTTAYVNFVDYGNNEDVLLENIYPIKSQDGDVIDVPIQCLSVQLQGLENFDWSEEILSYMDSLILDKNCEMHVKGSQAGLLTGTLSTEGCPDVAERMVHYISSTPPALLDSSSSTTNGAASSPMAPPLQGHVSSPPLSSASKSLPQGLLGHMTSSSSQFPDHVIQPPRYPVDHMTAKLPLLPNPSTNDNHDDEVD